jgi:hypothetical protein
MKNFIIILSMFILNVGCAQTTKKNQDAKFIDFINSFYEEKSDEILDLEEIKYNMKRRTPMTKDEALSFVYNTEDTTALYCVQEIFNMETEEILGEHTSLYLPDKYFRIEKENYFLLCYSYYECNGRYGQITSFIHCSIVDKNYNITDKLLVVNCDYTDECNIRSLLNPTNSKIFLLHTFATWDKQHETHKAYMYEVDNSTLKFRLIKEDDVKKGVDTGNLRSVLNGLSWQDVFLE